MLWRFCEVARCPVPSQQRGFGLLEVMLLVAVFGSLLTAGYLELRKRTTVQAARQEQAVLAQADAAVMTFSTVHHRLPCPDTDRDGLEDCASTVQKGWLPSTSLLLAGADAGVEVGQLRYLVQRGGATYDLASLADDWRPLEYAAPTFFNKRQTTAHGGDYKADILSLADLCQRLEDASKTTLTGAMAQVTATPARAVAYALAHPGLNDAAGNNSLFDGVNGAAGHVMEDPARPPILSAYDDLVFERSFVSLQQAFGCTQLTQSINTVALGLDVVAQIENMRDENKESAIRAVAFASLGAALTAVDLASSVIEATSDAGNAAIEFTACAASLGLAVNFCTAAPLHVASAAAAGVAGGLYAGSIAANVTAAVRAGNALSLVDDEADLIKVCPEIDFSKTLAAALKEWDDAKTALVTLESELLQKRNDLIVASAAKTTAQNALSAASSANPTLSSEFNQLINAADGWVQKGAAYDAAVGKTNYYQETYNSLGLQVTKYNNMLANRGTLTTQYQNDIAALDLQIAAVADGPVKNALIEERNTKAGELSLLSNVAALQAERDAAVTAHAQAALDLAAAQAAQATALTAISPFTNSYTAAYSALNASTAAVSLRALMDGSALESGATWPHENSKFIKPKKIEREIIALEAQRTAGSDRVAAAKMRYDELLAASQNPPDCTIDTGPGVHPWPSDNAIQVLIDADTKGATR